MNAPKILFIGEGHGAYKAYHSLIHEFNDVYILSGLDAHLDALAPRNKHQSTLSTEGFDVFVTAGYRHKFPIELIQKMTIINIHYALLPHYRGLHSLVWAMINKEPRLGLTIHIVNEAFDAGPILHQFFVENKQQTSWELMELFDNYVQENLGHVVRRYLKGEIIPAPQNEEEATWCARRNLEDCRIDFNLSHEDLRVFFRALVKPYPLPFILIKGAPYRVMEYSLKTRTYTVPTGRVVNVDQQGAWIKVKEGFLVVKTLAAADNTCFPAEQLLKLGMRL